MKIKWILSTVPIDNIVILILRQSWKGVSLKSSNVQDKEKKNLKM